MDADLPFNDRIANAILARGWASEAALQAAWRQFETRRLREAGLTFSAVLVAQGVISRDQAGEIHRDISPGDGHHSATKRPALVPEKIIAYPAASNGNYLSIAAQIGGGQTINLAANSNEMPGDFGGDFAESRRLARYVVGGVLGRGGMGEVVAAADPDLNREVAVKVLLPQFAGDLDHVEKFLVEAQVTGQLEHPNIVPVHELGLAVDGQVFFTMKAVRGRSLKAILSELRRRDRGEPAHDAEIPAYTLAERLDIFLKICDGVAFAHARGVVHRDLKPENIMVGEFGEVLVMDWGLAKVRGVPDMAANAVKIDLGAGRVGRAALDGDTEPQVQTLAGTVMGTPMFMPPEQARGDIDEIDARSDIYALGAILYIMLTGENPIDGRTVLDIVTKAAQGHIVPPNQRQRRISAELEAVITKAMAVKKGDRYATVPDLQHDIRAFLDGRMLAAVDYSLLGRLAKFARQHRAWLTTFAAVFVAAVLVAVIFLQVQAAREADAKRARQAQIAEFAAIGEQSFIAAQNAEAVGDFDAALIAVNDASTAFGQILAIDADDERGAKGRWEADWRRQQLMQRQQQMQAERDARQRAAAVEAAEKAAAEQRQQRANELADVAKTLLADARASFAVAVQKLATAPDADEIGLRSAAFAPFEQAWAKISKAEELDTDNPRTRELAADIARANGDAQQQWQQAVEKIAQLATANQHLADAQKFLAAGQRARESANDDGALANWLDAYHAANQAATMFAQLPASAENLRAAVGTQIDALVKLAAQATANREFQLAEFWLAKAAECAGDGPRRAEVQRQHEQVRQAASRARGYTAKLAAGQQAYQAGHFETALADFRDAQRILDTAEIRAEIERANYAGNLQAAREARETRRWRDALAHYSTAENFVGGNDDRKRQLEFLRAELTAQATADLLARARTALAAGGADELAAAEAMLADCVAIDSAANEARALQTQLSARKLAPTGFVYVPAGRVALGSPREADRNPPRTADLPAFYIATREVTVAEFRGFVDAGGYADSQWWDDAGWQFVQTLATDADAPNSCAPHDWAEQIATPARPVVGVSRHEAEAYARWLSAAEHQHFRLPTDAEWETVARHEPADRIGIGRLFPWGNAWEIGGIDAIAEMQPTGANPADKSAFGCLDLGGNAAEWVASDGDGTGIVRGASARMPAELRARFAQATKRGFAPASSRLPYLGFRLVREIRAD